MRAAMDALLLPVVAKRGKLRTLDLGCGTGYLMTHLESHYPIAGHVAGLDAAETALGFFRKRGGRELILADAVDVPLESASFDLITCTDVIQHLSGGGIDQRAVREMARLLKPGGILYLRTNTKQGVLHSRYDLAAVRALLAQNGFETVRATHLNMSGSMLATVRRRLKPCKHEHHHHDEHGHPSHGLVITPDTPGLVSKLKYLVTKLEAAVMGLGINLPFGHSCAVVARKI